MDSQYQAKSIETAAQAHWHKTDAYRVTEHALDKNGKAKPKFYACSMLPYPSGKLHMGHVRNYTINDMMTRQLRMKGYNVLQTMGWDAFGLPAENAAMKNGVAPAKWTYENIAYMKLQCQAMGWAIDWSREFATCDAEYYQWNQWFFLRMLEKGIVYKKTQVVNWDPVDMTVLANEQVVDGKGWRSGAPVEKREIPGYYMAITKYADELLDCVANKLTGWPPSVRAMQENWIGKSVGVRFAFTHTIRASESQSSPSPLGEGRDEGSPNNDYVQDGKLFVFTTRADTIMGVTFCAVAAEHPLASVAAARDAKVAAFVEETKRGTVMEADLATMEKKGVATGLFVTHPLTGAKVEVWVGNYVLMNYGDGAVMGVPGHDERDFAFAKKYKLPIKQVIELGKPYSLAAWQAHYGDYGTCIASGPMDGMDYNAAIDYVAAQTAADGGEKKTQYRLRDWGISRQRYWGTPIPIIHCDACGDVPVPDEHLPVVLPLDLVPDGSGNPLKKDERFLKCQCPRCGKSATRETDTMDTFVDSSWYYMRQTSPGGAPDYHQKMVSAANDYWMPMDQYIGGITHAVLHLLYARFWTKVMRDMGMLKFDEPFTNLLCQGMVLNHIYFRKGEKGGIEYFPPDDVETLMDAAGKPAAYRLKSDGSAVQYDGVGTMSKSKLNGVDPQEMIDHYGADAARLFVMFASPPEQTIEWSSAGVEGAQRFLRRVWAFAHTHADALRAPATLDTTRLSADEKALRHLIHSTLQQASFDYGRLQYNTVVSACMKMLNALESNRALSVAVLREGYTILLRVLYPVCPHITWQIWNTLGCPATMGDLLEAAWPEPDPAALEQDEIELVVQVNGKLRGHIRVPKAAAKDAIEKMALADEGVARHTEGKPIKKIIVVPGKLLNVVV
ncbi:MAG: leucine--tRNA ligase [Betaproteobacteria bacterium]|nr:leucine--tRNA ligase [Betaproteobacteria bacterium]